MYGLCICLAAGTPSGHNYALTGEVLEQFSATGRVQSPGNASYQGEHQSVGYTALQGRKANQQPLAVHIAWILYKVAVIDHPEVVSQGIFKVNAQFGQSFILVMSVNTDHLKRVKGSRDQGHGLSAPMRQVSI